MYLSEKDISQYRTPISFNGVKHFKRFLHSVMSNTIRPPIQSPRSFPQVLWTLSNNDAQSRWTSLKYNSFNRLFTNGFGTTDYNNIAVCKPMLPKMLPIGVLKNENVFTIERPVHPPFQSKKRKTRCLKTMVRPGRPAFLDD